MNAQILSKLDRVRKTAGEPSARGEIVREVTPGGQRCLIAYSHATPESIGAIIAEEQRRATEMKYTLEWKVYGHDAPVNLRERLLAAGFEPEPVEKFMVLSASAQSLAAFRLSACRVERITNVSQLEAVADISRNIGRANVDRERRELERKLENAPESMSIYVAYEGECPAACGRIHYEEGSEFADLCGGRTKVEFRHRGLYTTLVAARIREAIGRGIEYVSVDALPTSEPILSKRGFRCVTETQPFTFEPPGLH